MTLLPKQEASLLMPRMLLQYRRAVTVEHTVPQRM